MDSVICKIKELILSQANSGSGYPLFLRISNFFKELILSGELPANYKFPSDIELAASIGINHITLGKALNELRKVGLLERSPYRGTFVKELEETNNSNAKNKLVTVIFDDVNQETFQSKLFVELHKTLKDYHMVFLSSAGDKEIQFEQIKRAAQVSNNCGCLVWSLLDSTQVRQLMKIKPVDFPIVFMDKYYTDAGHDAVVYDGEGASIEIGEMFVKKGFEHFTFVTRNDALKYSSIADRYLGLKKVLARHNIEPDNLKLVELDPFKEIDTAQIASPNKKSVFIVSHINLLLKILDKIKELKLNIDNFSPMVTFEPLRHSMTPNDLAEFNDKLFEFEFDLAEFARESVDLLTSRINGDRSEWKLKKVKGEFVKFKKEKNNNLVKMSLTA